MSPPSTAAHFFKKKTFPIRKKTFPNTLMQSKISPIAMSKKRWLEKNLADKREAQKKTPLFDAVKKHVEEKVVSFHVPGHKNGKGLNEMLQYAGENMFRMDLNSLSDIDDLRNPVSVIADAQKLAADAFHADQCHFLVGGATSGVQSMLIASLRPGDRVILPRNCHKSAFSGLILSGAVPVYAPVEMNVELGIAMSSTYESIEKCFMKAPQTAALFLLHPNYYGYCCDLPRIFSLAREWEASILVDEAHGGHMLFHPEFPSTAMELGADLSVVSTHKTCGSLTQSAFLLSRGKNILPERIANTLSLLGTTSASYLLMCSLDLARKQMFLYGKEMLESTIQLVRDARKRINSIKGLYAFGKELVDGEKIWDFDETKLNIYVRQLGITGFEMEHRLRNEYNIQVELADLNNIMAIVTIGDTKNDLNLLVESLASIARTCKIQRFEPVSCLPQMPEAIVIPRDAFSSHKKTVTLDNAEGEICGEMMMSYPPGIPVVCPGERITRDIVDYIKLLKEHNCRFQGTADPHVNFIRVLGF